MVIESENFSKVCEAERTFREEFNTVIIWWTMPNGKRLWVLEIYEKNNLF